MSRRSLRAKEKGALHATEIPFVFSTVKAKYEAATTPDDIAIAAAVTDYWAAFAKTGNPNGAGRPKWPIYTAATDEIMDFTTAGPGPGPIPARSGSTSSIAWRPRRPGRNRPALDGGNRVMRPLRGCRHVSPCRKTSRSTATITGAATRRAP